MRRVVLLAMMLSISMIPNADASGGVIDSVNISGDGLVGEGPISVDIVLIGVGESSTSSIDWNVSLYNSAGNIIDSDSGNAVVTSGTSSNISTMLGDAPIGYSNLSITLTGDVGEPGENQYTEYFASIHRLRPMDISLSTPTLIPTDDNGAPTGNLSIHDGDYLKVAIPLVNNGDLDWNGSLTTNLDSTFSNVQAVNVSADSIKFYNYTYGPMLEGNHLINISLNNTNDGALEDESLNYSFEVGPPPLPEIILNLTRLNEPSIGNNVSWNIRSENIGLSDFDGKVICFFNQELVHSDSNQLQIGGSDNSTVTIVSKPGVLLCTTADARTSMTENATDVIDISSAVFYGAGHSTPSLLGGPWHVGDEIQLSMLLRNEGDLAGSAKMQIELNGLIQNGSITNLDKGKAGEVSLELALTEPGSYDVNWSVISQDGVVDSNLSGTLNFPIEVSQRLNISIEDLEYTETGINVVWSVELSEGNSRNVVINFGAANDGIEGDAISEERYFMPGKTYGNTNIGFQTGQIIFFRAEAMSWTVSSESILESNIQMPDYSLNLGVTLNPVTNPLTPTAGSDVTLSYTLVNNGTTTIPEGQIAIVDRNGELLFSKSTNSIAESSQNSNVVITWPSGQNVKIEIRWYVGDVSVSDSIIVYSKIADSDTSDFEIPTGGILSGLVLGMVFIFLVRIKNSPKSEKRKNLRKESRKKKSDSKVDVECPTCSRMLRVPADYTGGVRCPECDKKFEVEAENKNQEDESDTDKIEDNGNEIADELFASSSNDILECPKCFSNLKVPYEKRPAKARCPACEIIFEARKE